ncbi:MULTISPECIES: SCO family protein [unclassified Amycolatopsis]|uniref:SCO family protein n=1 Tax=unclassified Amycolatopsis TaxID=2618356 RepID=UPI001C6950D8|nr:SCO family protein [Amycolatopsis sp. DSM 110486]QYN19914.1 SCO family protein [Amycolatopsis sp. DSM 110486]
MTPIDATFSLVDHHGAAVTEQDYRGKWVTVFFGFTHCRMVCPRALGRLTTALDELGPPADKVQPLYITVDPERDSPEVMRAYLEGDHPRFTGLTGTPEQIERAKRAFRVFARRKDDPEDPDGYAVPHTAITYVLDPDGAYATHLTDGLDDKTFTERLRETVTQEA